MSVSHVRPLRASGQAILCYSKYTSVIVSLLSLQNTRGEQRDPAYYMPLARHTGALCAANSQIPLQALLGYAKRVCKGQHNRKIVQAWYEQILPGLRPQNGYPTN